VKQIALQHDLPVIQPRSMRDPAAFDRLQGWNPDVIVTAATGHILSPEVLALPTHGTVNVHASLLPRWRGAAPIQAALLAGDKETGVTIMCTDEGLDTGPILSQRIIPVSPRETASTLHDKLAQLGADLLLETLTPWLSGDLTAMPQPEKGVTIADRVKKGDGQIDWSRPAPEIDRQVRAFTPWPGTYTFWDHRRLKIVAAFPLDIDIVPSTAGANAPGTVIEHNGSPTVVTGYGLLRLDRLQLAGKRSLSGPDFIRGQSHIIGAKLEAH
jgi:methionyl-tRNA formyltransferase